MTLRKPTYEEASRVVGRRKNLIGSGTFRSAYHEPGSPWVFKKEHRDSGANREEYEAYLRYRAQKSNMPKDIRIPETHLIPSPDREAAILAMRYIPGGKFNDCYDDGGGDEYCNCSSAQTDRWGGCWSARFNRYTVDAHNDNVREYRGSLWLIDAQDFMNEEYPW